MILANATIYTADPARPFAGAMAVRAGRVLRVGMMGPTNPSASSECTLLMLATTM
jgi:predicted amidohydrolase YtcJ